jgi:hypothetical protein
MKYRYHKQGSRKGYVHREFDLFGADAARHLGALLGLNIPRTVNLWLAKWQRQDIAPTRNR